MGDGSLIGLANNAVESGVMDNAVCQAAEHKRQGSERHCDWNKGAGLPHDGGERTGLGFHVASSSGKDVFGECRTYNVGGGKKASFAVEKKRLKLRTIALSPITRIQSRKQVSERGFHLGHSLSTADLAANVRTRRKIRIALSASIALINRRPEK